MALAGQLEFPSSLAEGLSLTLCECGCYLKTKVLSGVSTGREN